jgi:DNA-binding XRE family transcriptional regulator
LNVTGEQLRAARAMARMEQSHLAGRANVSVETIKRLEKTVGQVSANVLTVNSIVAILESAGIVFTNGNEPGVKMSGWFIERYEPKGTMASEVRYFSSATELLSALTHWCANDDKASKFRVHCPSSATDAERSAITRAGGIPV